MEISIVCHDITAKGGIERVTVELASLFAKKGHNVTVYSLFKEFPSLTFDLDPKVKLQFINDFPYPDTHSLFKKTIKTLKSVSKLKKAISKEGLIIAQSTRSAVVCYLCGLSNRTIVCEHFKYGMYGKIGSKFRNYVYKHTLKVVTLTDSDRDLFNSNGISAVTIPNPCTFKIKEKTGTLSSKIIVSIGRLHYQKGFDLLLRALKKVIRNHKDWHVNIYGEGEEKDSLIKLSEDLGISDNVHFMGYTSNVSEVLSNASFYVLPSRYEGFPMCLIEAIAHRLPVVAFDCHEGPAVLLKNDAGILVENENIDKLSDAILEMIENPEKRINFSEKALANIKNLNPENIYENWMSLLNSLSCRNRH